MGIRHLQTFICEQPNGFSDVNIVEEIKKWQSTHSDDEPPIIVFDVMAFNPMGICNDDDIVLYELRYNIILKMFGNFYEKLHQLGVKIVFFCDGPVHESKLSAFIERQHERYFHARELLDLIYEGRTVEYILDNACTRFRVPIDNIVHGAKNYAEFIVALENECDLEIAEYATKNNALAIVSSDTDFLIFSGEWQYWSSVHVDMKQLQTKRYDRKVLRETLGLSEKQLPLFATIGGNDIMPFDEVKQLHCKLTENPMLKFFKIADFVRRYPNSFNLTKNDFLSIVTSIYGSISPELVKLKINLIKRSINSYNLKYMKTPLQDDITRVLHTSSNETFIGLLLGKTYYLLPPTYIDLSCTDMMPWYFLTLPIFAKQLGILFKHKNNSNITGKCHTIVSESVGVIEKDVVPIYPEFDIPDLTILLAKKENDVIDDINYKLLCWILSNKLTPDIIKKYSEHVLMDVLTTFYLVEMDQISILEADAVLLTLNNVLSCSESENNFKYPNHLNQRTFRFCSLYKDFYGQVLASMKICGFEKLALPFRLDCVYLHKLIEQLKQLKEDVYQLEIEPIKPYRLYVLLN